MDKAVMPANVLDQGVLEKMQPGEAVEVGTLCPGLCETKMVWTLENILMDADPEWRFAVSFEGVKLCDYALSYTTKGNLKAKEL